MKLKDWIMENIITYVPDDIFLRIKFYMKMHKKLNLKNPQTFNEKLQWLKLYNHHPKYTIMVDKYAAKNYVSEKIGSQHIIKTIGVWNNLAEIEWDILPNQFVLKTTHGGGNLGVIICRDKKKFNRQEAIKNLQESLDTDLYKRGREWPYKNVKKRIIAEELMFDDSINNRGGLTDYKFYCFNGAAYKVMLCLDRASGNTKFYSFDKDWNLLRHNKMGIAAPKDFTLPKPESMDKMFEIAETLSKDIPFARVDLYYVNKQIYFGEITLFPMSGFDTNILPEIDRLYGSMIMLPKR